MKKNILKEEIERNRQLMGLPINEGSGVLDKLSDLLQLGYEKIKEQIRQKGIVKQRLLIPEIIRACVVAPVPSSPIHFTNACKSLRVRTAGFFS